MNSVVVKIGDGGNRVDGEVIQVLTSERALWVHADHACHVKRAGLNRYGLRPTDSLCHDMQRLTCRYRFEWEGHNDEVDRVDLWTNERITFGPKPRNVDGKDQHINGRLYVARRLRHHRHRIFGEPGNVSWFGGNEARNAINLARVWERIEARTGESMSNPKWQRHPLGRKAEKMFLAFSLNHHVSAEHAQHLQGAVVDWRNLPGMTALGIFQTLNPTCISDARDVISVDVDRLTKPSRTRGAA